MTGARILFDTNVLIRFLNGEKDAFVMSEADKHISFLTEIELFCKPQLSASEKRSIAELVSACTVLPYAGQMKEIIVEIRVNNRLKMPDAFVAATALHYGLPLFTFDKGFRAVRNLQFASPL